MSQVFELAERVIEDMAVADPVMATFQGVAGQDDRMTDYGPEAEDARAEQLRGWLAELEDLPEQGPDDRLAIAVMRERLDAYLSMADSQEHLRDVNVLWGPVQFPRDVFTVMPTQSDEHWQAVAARLEAVPEALASVRARYAYGMERDVLPARRQVVGAARLAAVTAGLEGEGESAPEPWFPGFVAAYDGADPTLTARLSSAAVEATTAYADLARWLREDYAPRASEVDGVGEDRYARLARVYNGADLDLRDTYAWGWDELTRITARMVACASRLYGGVSPQEAQARLDEDPEHTMEGAEQTRDWLQELTDRTTASFDGRYFDIPELMRTCEVVLAPPGGAAAPYYIGPAEDFSRPGRTWLPVAGQTRFRTWWLTSVWYHEAVPGHHLQIGYAVLQREHLSRFQRLHGTSGHAEGWALYAERLMDELGYFDTPAVELGFLSAQAMRACRVVLDIGLHLDLPIPTDADPALFEGLPDARGAHWTPELARDFLSRRGLLPEFFATSEIDRYLGLPGQAISYKVGERVWLAARERAQAAPDFDLKTWHMRALALGSVGLDVLTAELARG